jgi:hypothetical protein
MKENPNHRGRTGTQRKTGVRNRGSGVRTDRSAEPWLLNPDPLSYFSPVPCHFSLFTFDFFPLPSLLPSVIILSR